jgi:multiple sugar transport system permease protein
MTSTIDRRPTRADLPPDGMGPSERPGGTRRRRKPLMPRVLGELARLPLYLIVAAVSAPFLLMTFGAFKTATELSRNPPTFFPADPTLANFAQLFALWPEVPFGFWRYVANTVLVSLAVTVGAIIIASLASYVITKSVLPGRRVLFVVVLATMMVPWQTAIIPNYLLIRDLGWINTFAAYIAPSLPSAFLVFFLVQFMRGIPDDLLDAARIDGAGEWRIWARIVMPLAWPVTASMSIFVFLGQWNAYLWPLIVVQTDDMKNLPLALATLNDVQNPQMIGVMLAASLLVSLPTIAMFILFQKHFTRGVTMSGVKG